MADKASLREGWYWSRDGQQRGPYAWEQLCQFAQEGSIQPVDLIWHVGWASWVIASQVPGLFGDRQTSPTRSAQRPPTKRRTLTPLRLLIGALIAFGLILLLLVLLVLIYPSASGPATITPVAVQASGMLRVDAAGGHFENGEIALSLPAGAVSSAIDLTLTRSDPTPTLPEEVTYQSARYNLTGPLHLLSGELQIDFALPPELSSAAMDDEEAFVVVVEEEVVTPSAGPAIDRLRLPAQIDRAAGVAHAVLTLPSDAAGLSHSPALASLVVPRSALLEDVPLSTLGLRLERGWSSDSLANADFRVTFPRRRVSTAAVAQLLLVLEDQKHKLESLGLSFAKRTTWPIEIELEDWGTTSGTQRYGLFVPSRWGANSCQLQFNQAYFTTSDAFAAEQREIQATAGHELFHFVQFLYEPQLAYSKATGLLGRPFYWLEEASAVWFEPLAVGDPDYLPAIARDNMAFVHTPLYFPEAASTQEHGYGASLFLRYLTRKYGEQLIGEVWKRAGTDNYSGTGAEALDKALYAYNDLETSASTEWPDFLEEYFTQPTRLVPELDVSGLTTKAAVLKAETVIEQDDVKLTFLHNLADRRAVAGEGWLKAETPATLKLQFPLKSLSAEAFRVSFRGDDTTQQILATPGQLQITVDAPEWSGVLVYAVPRGSDTSVLVPLAGAPFNFLSSGDPQAAQGAQLVVAGLSHAAGTGDYSGLLLIPFNYAGFSFTRREAGAATIKIELAFQAAPPALEPTPTVEPAAPTENPCAGLSPDDILHPSLNSKVMACRQRCIPIGGPTPTYEQLLACMNGGTGGRGGP